MSAVNWALTVVTWVALTGLGSVAVAGESRREWARTATGRSWVRRLGVLAGVLVAVAAGTFSVWPPGGVYVLVVAGVAAYAAGLLAAAGALGLASAAVDDATSLARLLRTFWYAAAVQFRATRTTFLLAFLAFGLSAVVAGVTVDPVVSAVGALGLGGVFASLFALAAVGVFVPGGYDESIAESLRAAN